MRQTIAALLAGFLLAGCGQSPDPGAAPQTGSDSQTQAGTTSDPQPQDAETTQVALKVPGMT
jgi:PBP1b-binding outer membrane lipoprotein LpoB